MSKFTGLVKKYRKISVSTIWGDFRLKKDKDEFKFDGSQIYTAMQGQGKSYSMIYHGIYQIKARYPKSFIVTNLYLRDYEPVRVETAEQWNEVKKTFDPERQYILFESHTSLMFALRFIRNDIYGVIFMIDEIHNYFHSHDSKSMPMWVVQVFSQQRKQHLVILGTVQDWEDLIKAIRKQIDNLIICHRYWYMISHTAINPRSAESNYGNIEYEVRKSGLFWMSDITRNAYDTYQVINSGREIMGGNDLNIGIKNDTGIKKQAMFGRG